MLLLFDVNKWNLKFNPWVFVLSVGTRLAGESMPFLCFWGALQRVQRGIDHMARTSGSIHVDRSTVGHAPSVDNNYVLLTQRRRRCRAGRRSRDRRRLERRRRIAGVRQSSHERSDDAVASSDVQSQVYAHCNFCPTRIAVCYVFLRERY